MFYPFVSNTQIIIFKSKIFLNFLLSIIYSIKITNYFKMSSSELYSDNNNSLDLTTEGLLDINKELRSLIYQHLNNVENDIQDYTKKITLQENEKTFLLGSLDINYTILDDLKKQKTKLDNILKKLDSINI